MITVDVRELQNRLSEHLRMVRTGEEIQVTDCGEAVAELHQPLDGPDSVAYPELVCCARTGKMRLGGRNHPGLYPHASPPLPPGAARRLLDEERGGL